MTNDDSWFCHACKRPVAPAQCEGDHCEIRTPAIVQRIKEACAQVADRAAAKAGNPNLDQPLMDVRRSTALEIAASIRALIPAPRTPAGCSGVDRDDIAERIEDRFEEVSYGLASQIGDEILKHFKVEKR